MTTYHHPLNRDDIPEGDGPYGYPEAFAPTGTFIDGIIPLEGSVLAEALRGTECDEAWVVPKLGVNFVKPWIITKAPDGPQDH